MRSVLRIIPNTITSMNLISGSLGVISCLGGHFQTAFLFMLASAAFDFFDGMSAKALGVASDIGKELDSLADVVSFGVLPSLMLFSLMRGECSGWTMYIPLVLAAFSALRLAKFNLDERQHDSFIGLATPASAMICGSLTCYAESCGAGSDVMELCSSPWFLPLVATVLSALLVSEIPMFAMKISKNGTPRRTIVLRTAFFALSAAAALCVLIFRGHWSLVVLAAFVIYILVNVCASFRHA